MEWDYIKPIETRNCIEKFARAMSFSFPSEFVLCVLLNNGGRPEHRCFDTSSHIPRVLKSFLSFNRNDKETVWKMNEWKSSDLRGRYIAFAIDNFGNLVCFDKLDSHIVFLDLERETIEHVSNSFSDFLDGLYTVS